MTAYQEILSTQLEQLKQSGSYRYFLDVNKSAKRFPNFYYEDQNGKKKSTINWCSNDYLCMSVNDKVIERFRFVAKHSGAGSGGTRNISGTTIYHNELEKALAGLHKKEAALVFSGAYLANLTTLGTLGKLFTDAVFLSDEKNHASLIEGIKASGCKKFVFKHNDTAHLEKLLKQLPVNQPKIIVFESVYSINGTIAPIDTQEARKVCFNHKLLPNIPENKRNRKQAKPEPKRMFNQVVYKRRFTAERSFAWIDKFRALLVRYDRRDIYFLSAHYIVFAMINLRNVTNL